MTEKSISPCPCCGHQPTAYRGDKTAVSHDGSGCRFDNIPFLVDEWNDLCDLVEKGRKYGLLEVSCKHLTTQRDEAVDLLNCAVHDLQDTYGFFDGLKNHCYCSTLNSDQGSCSCCLAIKIMIAIRESCKTFLARIDRGGGE